MVHGGPSLGFFSSTLFECIVNGNVSPTIEDVHDSDLRDKITKISEAGSMEELMDATDCMSDYLANAGCLWAVKCLKDKDLLVQDILLFQVVNRLHGPLERAGSNRRMQENITMAFWRDYLLDAEEGNSPCSLERILMFVTGCSDLSAIGLKPQSSIEFLHTDTHLPGSTQQRDKFPTANTCVNCLHLPLYKDYTAFKDNMDFAICNTQGFGQK
ncbi:hypothetical protein SKAU_G00135230 [Synaphobranchus kaupii]|uniref:HECT-type E3 ubiquitin transferase n=1 Tax=Synaphobranchus kaupii TaxID=118154 RepID=A0A9Q1FS84_SYNKA|nr:hypothetical protein SKAU_G00135230 [Synaphobranchus kaupii]